MKTKISLLTILAMVAAAGALAGDWYVNPAGDDAHDCLAPATACKTINAAIGKASPGDTVRVAAGIYDEQVPVTQTLTLLGARAGIDARTRSGPESVIDNACGPVQIKADNVTLDGFTIQGSSSQDPPCFSAGIYMNPGDYNPIAFHGGAQILNNIIQNNFAGIELNNDGTGQSTTVRHNLIRNNNNGTGPMSGSGIRATYGLQNALIDSNTFSGHATASIMIQSTSSSITVSTNALDAIIILNATSGCSIIGNTNASVGMFVSSGISITGNTSIGNTSPYGTIHLGGGTSSVTIAGNVLANGVEAIVIVNPYADPPLSVPANSSVTVNDNCISGNSTNGLRVNAGAYAGGPLSLDATSNNWGAVSGPSGTGPGTGDRITDPDSVVDFSSFVTTGDSCLPQDTPPERTSVSVICDPGAVPVGIPTTCTATVTNTSATHFYGAPQGTAKFGLGGGPKGTFSPSATCSLTPAGTNASTCSVTFTPTSGAGTAKVHANYTSSDAASWKNAGNSPDFNLTVTQDKTKVSVSCSPNLVRVGDETTCTATVTDTAPSPNEGSPLGFSTFSLGGGIAGNFSGNPCTLTPALPNTSTCTVTFTPTSAGKAKIRASYDSGDPTKWADAGNSPDFSLTVPADGTSVSVSCDSPVQVGHATICTVTVTDTATPYYGSPVGTSKFGLGRGVAGTFSGSPCTLTPALPNTSTCTVAFTPSGTGTAKVRANYTSSDSRWNNAGNSPDFSLTVTP